MPQESLETRVEMLEEQMTALAGLPAQVAELASQVSQLRVEMHAGFSAIRDEIGAGDDETMRQLREEIRAGDEETRRVLREEIRAGDEETRTQMRILHEDVIGRLILIQEGLGVRRRRAPDSPRGAKRKRR